MMAVDPALPVLRLARAGEVTYGEIRIAIPPLPNACL
jgi:hypothetical protein